MLTPHHLKTQFCLRSVYTPSCITLAVTYPRVQLTNNDVDYICWIVTTLLRSAWRWQPHMKSCRNGAGINLQWEGGRMERVEVRDEKQRVSVVHTRSSVADK